MKNLIGRTIPLIIIAVALAGCFGPQNLTPRAPGPETEPDVAFGTILDQYQRHAEDRSWTQFANLYAYPFTFSLREDNVSGAAASEDELREIHSAETLEEKLEQAFGLGPSEVTVQSYQLRNVVELPSIPGQSPDEIRFQFDQVYVVEIATPAAAQILLPLVLFAQGASELHDDPIIQSVRLDNRVIPLGGGPNVVTAHSTVIFRDAPFCALQELTGSVRFGFERVGGQWKIKSQDHTWDTLTNSRCFN